MPIAGLDHYNIRASRSVIEELCNFYVNVLGLEPGVRPPFKRQGYWLYASGRPLVHLSVAAENESRQGQVTNTLDHIAFTCTDYAHFEATLQRHEIPYETDTVPGTAILQIFISDPAGNGVELNFAPCS
jgi:catechol-2,3-dioxygenase